MQVETWGKTCCLKCITPTTTFPFRALFMRILLSSRLSSARTMQTVSWGRRLRCFPHWQILMSDLSMTSSHLIQKITSIIIIGVSLALCSSTSTKCLHVVLPRRTNHRKTPPTNKTIKISLQSAPKKNINLLHNFGPHHTTRVHQKNTRERGHSQECFTTGHFPSPTPLVGRPYASCPWSRRCLHLGFSTKSTNK